MAEPESVNTNDDIADRVTEVAGVLVNVDEPLSLPPVPSSSTPRLVLFFCGMVYEEVSRVEFTESMLYHLAKLTMETVETHASLSGKEKKQLVVDVVRQVVMRKPMNDAIRQRCLHVVDSGVLADMIELLVAASKGQIAINNLPLKPKSCCTVS